MAQRSSRIRAWGCCLFAYKGFSQVPHLQIVHSLTLSFYKPLLFLGLEERKKSLMIIMKVVFKILVIGFILLVGCTKNDVITEEEPIPEPEIPQNPYDWFGGYMVEDTTGFDRETPLETRYFSEDTTLLYGIKHGKLWLGMFDAYTKKELNSWSCLKETSIAIQSIEFNSYKQMFNGFVLLLQNQIEEDVDIYPFFLNDKHEAFDFDKITVSWGNDNGFIIQSIDQNIAIYHTYYSGNIYSQTGDKIISSIEFSDDFHFGKEQYYISGFKNDKLWFAFCENGVIKGEYTTINDYDRDVKFDLGYGEYKDYHIKSPQISYLKETSWGYAFCLKLEPSEGFYDTIFFDFFICSNGVIYPINIGYQGSSVEIGNWYDNSVIVHLWSPSDKYEVYSSKGELLYQVEKNSPMGIFHPVELMEPISFSEYIYVDSKGEFGTSVRFLKCNLKKQDDYIFESYVGDLPKDSRVTVTLIDKKTTLWRYQFDIVNYDGSKKQFYVDLNIQTGEITYV